MEPVEELVRTRVPDRTVELRVHGVSGTPPQVLLGAFPVRVEGDADAGFYRAHDAGAAGGIAEAFSWGGLTSRRRLTALWLFLAPLALVNVAGWMTPTHSIRERTGPAERWRDAAFRVVTAVATVLVAAIGLQGALSVMGVMTADAQVAPGRAAAGIALAALVPVGLHLLTKVGGAPDDRDAHDDPWGRARAFASLGQAHLALGLATVAALGLLVTREPGSSWSGSAALAAAGAAVIAALVVVLRTAVMGPDRGAPWGARAASLASVAVGIAVVEAAWRDAAQPAAQGLTLTHFGLAAMAALALSVALIAERRMPVRASAGHSVAFATLGLYMAFAAFGALSYGLLGLASESSALAFIQDPEPPTMFRLIDFAAVVLTCAVLWIAARLVRIASPLAARGEAGVDAARRTRAAIAAAPRVLRHAGLGMLAATLVLIGAETLRFALPDQEWAQTASAVLTDPRQLAGAVGWLFVAYLAVCACRGRLSALLTLVATVVVVVVLVRMLASAGFDPLAALPVAEDATVIPTLDQPWVAATSFTLIAVVVSVFFPAAAVLYFVLSASGNRESRRGVGVLWDLTNFWPRLYHPWAPPPYSETAIPALERRLRHLHEDHPSHTIVLSCHSQGAVLGFPVMRRVLENAEVPGRSLRFLSYGNLLAAHYQQLFPHLFDDDRLASLETANPGRWIHLFRETDPLGHPIGAIGGASRLVGHTPTRGVDHVLAHSSYHYSPEYQAALNELSGESARGARRRPESKPRQSSGPREWWRRATGRDSESES